MYLRNCTLLIPIHQRNDIEKKFNKVINSIFKNTFIPKKILIIIDGKIKNKFLLKILKYKKKIKIVYPKKKLGISKILNLGLSIIKTKWIIRADGDDINHPTRFEEISKYFYKNFDLIGSFMCEINSSNEKIIRSVPVDYKSIKKFCKTRNPFNHPTVAFNRNTAVNLGGYPEIDFKEDYGLWVKFISKKKKNINISKNISNFLYR